MSQTESCMQYTVCRKLFCSNRRTPSGRFARICHTHPQCVSWLSQLAKQHCHAGNHMSHMPVAMSKYDDYDGVFASVSLYSSQTARQMHVNTYQPTHPHKQHGHKHMLTHAHKHTILSISRFLTTGLAVAFVYMCLSKYGILYCILRCARASNLVNCL